MLSIVASLAVMAFPEPSGAVRLLGTDTRSRIQLVDVGDNGDLAAMTRDQLWKERDRLGEEPPGIVGPVVLGSVGFGTFAIFGLYALALGLEFGDYAAAVTFLAVLSGIGLLVAAVGVIWFVARLNARNSREERLKAIDARLPAMEMQAPPPPPPPPPGAQALIAVPMRPVFYF